MPWGSWLIKEFGPANWFGSTWWRTTLTESFGLKLPATHHPEPARALEAFLTGTIAVLWYLWVRTLALERQHRAVLIWSLFLSAALVAGVSFATTGIDAMAIYGLRYTPGWTGFGPFPNRNHTASLLAMGLVLGAGCVAWAGSRRKYALMLCGLPLAVLTLAALLGTKSRGGLIVAAVGLALFFALTFCKFRSRRSLGLALATILVLVALGLAYGAPVIARFASHEKGMVSNQLRVEIWRDAIEMWKDAPLFGHGLNTFTQLFPLYQRVETGGAAVLHPESSWLQWLTEFGLFPVVQGVFSLLIFTWPRFRGCFTAHSSFFLLAAGFAAVGALLVHALFDVPAHRWGTAGFALAILAIVTAPATRPENLPNARRAAMIPLAIALFWSAPLFFSWPAWSPLSLARLLAHEQSDPRVPLTQLEQAAKYFPLSGPLHQAIGMHQLESREVRSEDWQREFRLAARLMPGSWGVAADQAYASARFSPGMTLHYWQLAIERAGHRAEEVLGYALQSTVGMPGAAEAWQQYTETHPELLLSFAQLTPGLAAEAAYQRWWELRGSKSEEITRSEVEAFYRLAPRWGRREELEQWQELHPELRATDYLTWARLLAGWRAYEAAWTVLALEVPEPAFPTYPPRGTRDQLEHAWQVDPQNVVNALELAQTLHAEGAMAEAQKVILEVGQRPSAPDWFRRKAAHLFAAAGSFEEAVELVLRPASNESR